jgi:hypothetical protein
MTLSPNCTCCSFYLERTALVRSGKRKPHSRSRALEATDRPNTKPAFSPTGDQLLARFQRTIGLWQLSVPQNGQGNTLARAEDFSTSPNRTFDQDFPSTSSGPQMPDGPCRQIYREVSDFGIQRIASHNFSYKLIKIQVPPFSLVYVALNGLMTV